MTSSACKDVHSGSHRRHSANNISSIWSERLAPTPNKQKNYHLYEYEMNSYVKFPLEYLKIEMLRDKTTKSINLRFAYKK